MYLEYTFKDLFASLSLKESLGAAVQTTPLESARLVGVDEHLVDSLGARSALEYLTTNTPLEGFASVYAGHQFGGYTPRLGDGRAALIGELKTNKGSNAQLIDLVLKGSGPTPYSRMGDGKAVLRSTVREYLAGIALNGLKIPTTLALGFSVGDAKVQRECLEPEALLLRTSRGHMRFGHFEYLFHNQKTEALQDLILYCANRFYEAETPFLSKDLNAATTLLFTNACKQTATLIAQWQTYGFCHGVMNTDNMSIIGETLDYGPFAFMEAFDSQFICNHSDTYGRYAFDQQPSVALWNLHALASCFSEILKPEEIDEGFYCYKNVFESTYLSLMGKRLHLADSDKGKDKDKSKTLAYVNDFLRILTRHKLDYNNSFLMVEKLSTGTARAYDNNIIAFAEQIISAYDPSIPKASIAAAAADICEWLTHTVIDSKSASDSAEGQVNPKVLLRNAFAEEAISEITDWAKDSLTCSSAQQEHPPKLKYFNALSDALHAPFDDSLQSSEFAKVPAEPERYPSLSCSS